MKVFKFNNKEYRANPDLLLDLLVEDQLTEIRFMMIVDDLHKERIKYYAWTIWYNLCCSHNKLKYAFSLVWKKNR